MQPNAFGRFLLIFVLLSLAVVTGCGDKTTEPPKPPPLPSIVPGAESTLEIMTWNIEWFPKLGQNTIDHVVDIIDSLEVDIIAVQEIADTSAFRTLIQALEGYQGIYSPDDYGPGEYQKTGILYKESVVSVGSFFPLFTDDAYAFPRPPMKYHITVSNNERSFEFRLIVLHLKASEGDDNLARRRAAAAALRAYLDDRMQYDEVKDYAVAGDWNDEIDDPPWWNAFSELTAGGNYQFLTSSLAGNDRYASYPGSSSLIDHVLVSADMLEEYFLGSTYTQRLDDVFPDYLSTVSDHRPVMSVFPIF